MPVKGFFLQMWPALSHRDPLPWLPEIMVLNLTPHFRHVQLPYNAYNYTFLFLHTVSELILLDVSVSLL